MNPTAHRILLILVLAALPLRAEIKITTERNENDVATRRFKFKNVPAPSRSDAATTATFTIVEGERDSNGGGLEKLHDGNLPAEEDQPADNFFFNAGTDGGRVQVDLGKAIEIKQVNTYSWHPAARAPQVYVLYASDGAAPDFNPRPGRSLAPDEAGWKKLTAVDTRPKERDGGGQYGVSISDSSGSIGRFRYLLFKMSRTEDRDGFGNTFYSEIDVVDRDSPAIIEQLADEPKEAIETFAAEEGKYQISINTTAAPDLTEWARRELGSMAQQWYPKLAKLLPSDGFDAPKSVTITFREGMRGTPAATGGNRIGCNIDWFRKNLQGEAKGAVFHEMVHVVQQYGRARRTNPNATRAPGWLVEGIPDYLRWFLFEPESHGAEITKRNLPRARFDASYRITANFLNWVAGKYDKDIVPQLNAAMREGRYEEEMWKTRTSHTVQELGEEWKKALEAKPGESSPAPARP